MSSSQIDVFRECRAVGMSHEEVEQVSKVGLTPDDVIRQLRNLKSGGIELPPETQRQNSGAFNCLLGPYDSKFGVLNTRRVHVVSGNSGAGKTVWVNQMLDAQLKDRTFFGRVGAGWEYLCLWADRGEDDITEQLTAMDMMDSRHRHHAVSTTKEPAETLADYVGCSQAKFAFIEGIDLWATDYTNKRAVAQVMESLRNVATHYDIGVLLSIGSQKFKPKEQYAHTRARVSGADSWVRMAHTCINITEDAKTEERVVTIDARTGRKQVVRMEFRQGEENDGRLHVVETPIIVGPEAEMIRWFAAHPDSTWQAIADRFAVKRAQAFALAKKYGGS